MRSLSPEWPRSIICRQYIHKQDSDKIFSLIVAYIIDTMLTWYVLCFWILLWALHTHKQIWYIYWHNLIHLCRILYSSLWGKSHHQMVIVTKPTHCHCASYSQSILVHFTFWAVKVCQYFLFWNTCTLYDWCDGNALKMQYWYRIVV